MVRHQAQKGPNGEIFFTKDKIDRYCPTKNMWSDILTKPE